MSIHDAVQQYCTQGGLHRLLATGFLATERRKLCVSEKVRSLVGGPWQDGPQMRVGQRVAARLMAFIEEEYVTVRQGPPANDTAQVARLVPHDVFEIRCFDAEPSV